VSYRVDNVPWPLRPFWLAYSYLTGVAFWTLFLLLNLTCRIGARGTEHLEDRSNHIFCLWHGSWFPWFATFVLAHDRHVLMQHPAAFTKPVHVVLRLMGIRILLGSGGEEGRQAAERLVDHLRGGWSTAISPDGPAGPAGVMKKGVLHIALQSGVPVIPVRFVVSRGVNIPSWDGKRAPLPFSRITVIYGEPVIVTEENFEEAGRLLAARMSDS
jgi:lysophospholipid acyltransferase (LPLAT)-like uncharacterized protein